MEVIIVGVIAGILIFSVAVTYYINFFIKFFEGEFQTKKQFRIALIPFGSFIYDGIQKYKNLEDQ